jgi:uncharacterized protein (DUF2342 family)
LLHDCEGLRGRGALALDRGAGAFVEVAEEGRFAIYRLAVLESLLEGFDQIILEQTVGAVPC